jgi:hypothetical protein
MRLISQGRGRDGPIISTLPSTSCVTTTMTALPMMTKKSLAPLKGVTAAATSHRGRRSLMLVGLSWEKSRLF